MEKSRHTVLLRTLCFILNNKNQVLLMERGSGKFDAGMFNVLGGHVEKGEDIVESANREIYEESGIKPNKTKIIGIIHVSDFFSKNILMFVTKSHTNQIETSASEEGSLRWVNMDEIDKYKIYDDVLPFLKRIKEDKGMFIGTSQFDGKGTLLELSIRDL